MLSFFFLINRSLIIAPKEMINFEFAFTPGKVTVSLEDDDPEPPNNESQVLLENNLQQCLEQGQHLMIELQYLMSIAQQMFPELTINQVPSGKTHTHG